MLWTNLVVRVKLNVPFVTLAGSTFSESEDRRGCLPHSLQRSFWLCYIQRVVRIRIRVVICRSGWRETMMAANCNQHHRVHVFIIRISILHVCSRLKRVRQIEIPSLEGFGMLSHLQKTRFLLVPRYEQWTLLVSQLSKYNLRGFRVFVKTQL